MVNEQLMILEPSMTHTQTITHICMCVLKEVPTTRITITQ